MCNIYWRELRTHRTITFHDESGPAVIDILLCPLETSFYDNRFRLVIEDCSSTSLKFPLFHISAASCRACYITLQHLLSRKLVGLRLDSIIACTHKYKDSKLLLDHF